MESSRFQNDPVAQRPWNQPLGLKAVMTPPIFIIYLSIPVSTRNRWQLWFNPNSEVLTGAISWTLTPSLLAHTSSAVRTPRVLPISSLDHNFLICFIPVNWNSFPGWFFSFCSDSWGEPTPLIFLEGYFPFSAEWNCSFAALVACGNQYKHLMRKVRQTGTSGRQHHQPLRKSEEVQGGPDWKQELPGKPTFGCFSPSFSSPAGAEPSWSSLDQARCCSCYQVTLLPVLLGSAVAPQTLRMPCLYFLPTVFCFGVFYQKTHPRD